MPADRHILCYHDNATPLPMSMEYQDLYWARQSFWEYVGRAQVNWVKLYTLRGGDGAYLFQMEFQQRPEKPPVGLRIVGQT